MSAVPWSAKGEKTTPGVAADEIMIIDSEDIVLATKNKRMDYQNLADSLSSIAVPIVGSSIVYVASESDLPPLLGGFHQLENEKNYVFTEPMFISDPILFPAGWIGKIVKTFVTTPTITYIGSTPMFQTLNIDGTITGVVDAGGGAITVTTSVAHNLINGQFVNITGTTSYNEERLVISNESEFTFDVQIAFVADETGAFNTGYRTILFQGFDAQNGGTTTFMDLTSSGVFATVLSFDIFAEIGFLGPGIIRGGVNVVTNDAIWGFATSGLTLEDCQTGVFDSSTFIALAPSSGLTGITITGAATDRFSMITSSFTMMAVDQFPVRIDSSVVSASEILFSNTPDNAVATDYFDTSAGGLDQTDPQVTAENNGARADSMVISESSSTGILEVDGSGGIPVAIVDITPAPGDWVEDTTTETLSVDTTTGIVTYNGLNTITAMIKFSLSAEHASGSAQIVDFTLYINGVPQTKSTITITTTTSPSAPGVYNGGNFSINPGDTLQLFKDNTSNTNNTNVENAILLFNID